MEEKLQEIIERLENLNEEITSVELGYDDIYNEIEDIICELKIYSLKK